MNWQRLAREAGKTSVGGLAGGVLAGRMLDEQTQMLEMAFTAFLLFIIVVLAFGVFEKLYGKPATMTAESEDDAESTTSKSSAYAS